MASAIAPRGRVGYLGRVNKRHGTMRRWSGLAVLLLLRMAGPAAAQAQVSARALLGADYPLAQMAAQQDERIVVRGLAAAPVRVLGDYRLARSADRIDRPAFSPDGQQVLWAFNGTARVARADGRGVAVALPVPGPAYAPGWWRDPANNELCVVYMDRAGKHWYPADLGTGATWRLRPASGQVEKIAGFPCDGGLSPSGRFLGEAYGGALVADLVLDRFWVLNHGRQACSASLGPYDQPRLMMLYLPHDAFGIRDPYDREVWRMEKPERSAEWVTPRWSLHPDFCTASARFGAEYKIVIIRISTRAYAVLDDWPGNWVAAQLWLPPGPAGQPPGPAAAAVSPGAATQALAEAAAGPPLKSRDRLINIAGQYAAAPIGAAAEARLRDPAFQRACAAEEEFAALQQGLARFNFDPDAAADGPRAWTPGDKRALLKLGRQAAQLAADYPESAAARTVRAWLRRYKPQVLAADPPPARLVLEGTIAAVSTVPTAQQIAPYPEALVWIMYRVDRVLEGRYNQALVPVVHWGMRDRVRTPAADWAPGRRQRLVLEPFLDHPELHGMVAAQDAYDQPDLDDYWAVAVEDL